MSITQTITPFSGDAPNSNTQPEIVFENNANLFAEDLVGLAPELNTWAGQANATKDEINQIKLDTDTIKNQAQAFVGEASNFADLANNYAQVAQSVANFVGDWADQSGAATVPTSVYHNGRFWALRVDVANISANTPRDASNVWALIQSVDIVRVPVLIAPLSGATGVSPQPLLEADSYANVYSFARDYREFQVDLATGDFSLPAYTFSGDVDTHTVTTTLDFNEGYKWRCRDVAIDGTAGRWSAVAVFNTGAVTVAQPTLTVDGSPSDVPEKPTLTTSAFAVIGGTDTHLNTDWQILDDQLQVVWESLADSANKLSIVVAAGILLVLTTYTLRARHRGTTYGASAWVSVVATTKEKFGTDIGEAGGQGFGVGVYPDEGDLTSLGLTGMAGYTDPASPNYGNYINTNGSVMGFVPKFYYRIGDTNSPRFADYGLNAIDISGADEAGYVLHRAFIDGGAEKNGFFIDKYLISKNTGNTAAVSVKNGVPISLTASSTYTDSNGFLGGTGILADAVLLCRSRGDGYNQASAFMYGAVALLATAHAQAATSTTFCAWYDPAGTTNFVKGCNNSALSDVNDTSITFTTAGDSGNANKPLTGSAVPFAKTTHNGQECGIADLNGAMWEPALGVTSPGTSATSTTQITNTTFYLLKESVALKDLTHGWNTGTDAWGDTAHIESLYDSYTAPTAINGSTAVYWGNGNNQVFSGASTGVNHQVEGFMPLNNASISASGTNQFGNDYYQSYNLHNMFPLVGGTWSNNANAGLFSRNFINYRSNDDVRYGCRGSAYAG